jgi:25S rRNA (uracil2634-N3)-methyltransferase
MGAKVLHGISAKSMMRHSYLETRRFYRIVFNFPHAGFNGKEYEMHVVMYVHVPSMVICIYHS